MAVFRWATHIMDAEGPSATKVTSPKPIHKVISAMMEGEESKGDTGRGGLLAAGTGGRCTQDDGEREQGIMFAESQGCEEVGEAAAGGAYF